MSKQIKITGSKGRTQQGTEYLRPAEYLHTYRTARSLSRIMDGVYELLTDINGFDLRERHRSEMWITRLSIALRKRPNDAKLQKAIADALDGYEQKFLWTHTTEMDANQADVARLNRKV